MVPKLPLLISILLSVPSELSFTNAQLHSYSDEVIAAIKAVDGLQIETPFTNYEGIVIHAITGSISAFASGLIIFVIIRSNNGLSTSFHRLMLGMSLMDILESLMIAITTLPMPADMVYEQFKGVSIGNNFTCQAQGAIVNGAGLGTLTYTAALCFFFLCQIGFQMEEGHIAKYVEPFLHLFCVGAAISLGTLGVLGRFYNPMPYQSWCSVATFPWYCTGDGVGSGVIAGDNGSRTSFNECSLGVQEIATIQQNVALYVFLMYLLVLISIFLSMISIMILVVRRHFLFKRYMKSVYGPRLKRSRHGGDRTIEDRQREDIIQEAKRNRKVTNVILVQCIAYIFACFAVQIFPILNFNVSKAYELYRNRPYTIAFMIIFPLQGLFNFIIFISHKMYNLSFVHDMSERTLIQRFKEALTTREHPLVVLSNVSLVSSQDKEDGNDSPEMEEGFDPDLSYDPSRSKNGRSNNGRSNNGPGASHSELLSVGTGTKKEDDVFLVNSTSASNVDSNALSIDDASRSRKSIFSGGGMFSYFTNGSNSKSGHDDVSKAVSSL